MNIPEFCVKRPIFISMVSCIVLILGGVALSYLPVDLMPDITYPGVTIVTTYEDASPEEVEELISKKIETALSAVSGVKEITSTSGEGSSNVTVSFNWGTNLDAAVSDVRDRLDRVEPRLPDDADKPILYKFDSASSPIMRIGVATDIDLLDARKLIEDQIQYRLERIDGVASIEIHGGLEREIQVLFDVDKARMLDTQLENVLSVLENANVTTPAGNLREDRIEVRVRTPGTFTSVEQICDTVIATGKNGEKIRLGDVAEVIDTHKKVTRFVRVNGKNGIMIQVYKQSGANTVSVANSVLKEMEKLNVEFGSQVRLNAIINSAEYIENSIAGVADSALTGGLLAIIVLFLFLRNFGSTIVIGISIPMSIIATFALIYFCGYNLNIMTLGGLGARRRHARRQLDRRARKHHPAAGQRHAARRGGDQGNQRSRHRDHGQHADHARRLSAAAFHGGDGRRHVQTVFERGDLLADLLALHGDHACADDGGQVPELEFQRGRPESLPAQAGSRLDRVFPALARTALRRRA